MAREDQDARGIITNYSYDALNRLITKTYPNDPATPALSYTCDQEYPFQLSNNENNPIGHLNSIQEALSTMGPNTSALLTSTFLNDPTFYPGGAVKTANLAIDPTTQVPGITLSRTFDNRGRITGETDFNSQQQPAYNYSVNYDGNGNVTGYNDSVTGTWAVTNDALHRLLNMSGTSAGVAYTAQETYDHFGNRNVETVTVGSDQMQPSPYLHFTAGNNRADEGMYDNAGNPFSDGTNNYLYDAENRICAVQQAATGSGGGLIGYLYAPDGTRLGKNANLTSFSCDMTKNGMLTSNGLVLTSLYTVGPQGEQLVETDNNHVTDRTYPIPAQLQLHTSNHGSPSTLIQRPVRSVSHPNRF